MNIDISYYSAIGGRKVNEDTVSVLESGNALLALVADGLGGHGGGDAASQCAVSAINSELQNCAVNDEAMIAAITDANQRVLALQADQIQMKTTIAALWMRNHAAVAANVGDSRIYQIRGGEIIYQSVDHSVAQMAVYVGEITPEQIRGNRDRNKLIRALGSEQNVKPDSKVLSVEQGDCFLLCSDGFWEVITEAEMLRSLENSEDVAAWLKKMRSYVEVNGRHGMDNHSAIALKIC